MIGFAWTITIKKQLTSGPTAGVGALSGFSVLATGYDPLDIRSTQLALNASSFGTIYRSADGSATTLNTGDTATATRMWWELTVELDLAALVGSVQWRWTLVTKDASGSVLSTTSGSSDDTTFSPRGQLVKTLRLRQGVGSTGSPAVNVQTITFAIDSPLEVDTLAPPMVVEGDPFVGSTVDVVGANTPGGSDRLWVNGPQDVSIRHLDYGPRFLARRTALGVGFDLYRQQLGGDWELVGSHDAACDLGTLAVNGPVIAARTDWISPDFLYSLDYGNTWLTAVNGLALVDATNEQWAFAFIDDGPDFGGGGSSGAQEHLASPDGLSLGLVWSHYISGTNDLLNAIPYSYEAYLAADSDLHPMRSAGEVHGLPQPVLYRTADGTWHVGWFAGGQWREYRSDDLLGSAWTAETPQDLGNLANLANCALGIGRDGRQVAVGYLVGWSGGPDSQLVIWTRSGYGGTWSKAPTIFQPASCVMPYIFEGDDGWWELGWLLGGTFSRYRALDPAGVDAWVEVT